MRKKLLLRQLRNSSEEIAQEQPIAIHCWVLYDGDGVSGPLSWSWLGSWVGRIDRLGREVWFTMPGPASSNVAKRSFTVLIPYSTTFPNYPQMGNKVELFDSDGSSKGVFRVNFVDRYEIDGEVYKVELNVEELQP